MIVYFYSTRGGLIMKYSEAEKQIKRLSSKYSIDMDKISGNFNVNYKGIEIAFVNNDSEYSVGVWNAKIFYKSPFSNKLYMILSELAMTPLAERVGQKKYFIHVLRSQQDGYLALVNDKAEFGSQLEATGFNIKTKFTKREIRQLKKREDIPLDWDKVTLGEAN